MRVAAVTGSRADYGLLRPTLDALREHGGFDVRLLVTAMHLDPEYGETLEQIEADGHAIAARVPAGVSARGREDFARNLGLATVGLGEALAACAPDALLVLGDRFETLAAALAALGQGLPVVHMHGGELSEGSLDDSMRHCITKLAHLHLVATRSHAERVCQLGEDPSRVYVVGAAGLESIRRLGLLGRDELAEALEVDHLAAPLVTMTFHPASLDPHSSGAQAEAVAGAVDDVLAGEGCVVVTLPNDDLGSASVRARLTSWARGRDNVHVFAALGQHRYLSLLSHADAVLGNSSSALIEAPSFRLPVVNVGERQRGRLAAANVLDCAAARPAVAAALRTALDPAFRASLGDLRNPYDRGDVSARVLAVLRAAPLQELLDKRFYDLADAPWRRRLALAEVPAAGTEKATAGTKQPTVSAERPAGGAKRMVVVGAGGHARCILDALDTSHGALRAVACTDPDPARRGTALCGVPIVGDDELLPALLDEGVLAACVGVGGVGDNRPRAKLHADLLRLGFALPPVVHDTARVAADVAIGPGSVVLAGAVVCTGAVVGAGVIVGAGAVVEHDCSIGDHAHLASGCVLGGAVAVGAGALVGLGATVLQRRRVGAWAVVGAGAVVIRDVPAGETVVGSPAAAHSVAAHSGAAR
jgi:UDP-hydrolysing UDP-N-acetyl-D-glucosamine 2-epimerase